MERKKKVPYFSCKPHILTSVVVVLLLLSDVALMFGKRSLCYEAVLVVHGIPSDETRMVIVICYFMFAPPLYLCSSLYLFVYCASPRFDEAVVNFV